MTHTDIAHLRLQNQRIAQPAFEKPEDVVRWMGAMQAQDYQQAIWGIGVRMPTATVADVEQAIADAKIVRTWPMRGTIHFVAPEDAKWMLQLSASRMIAKDERRLKQLELDTAMMERCQTIFCEALQGGKRLSRPDMLQLLEDRGISTQSQRGYHILWYISQRGVICPGPMDGRQQTFVLLDEWVPHSRRLSREESLAELARRYFISHGPAAVHDFAWWAGITVTEARAGIEGARAALVSEKIDGKEYWLAADTPALNQSVQSGTFLLPGFDEYLLGYTERRAVLDPQHAQKVVPGANGIFFPIVVTDGQMTGTWKRTIKKDKVLITREVFNGLSDAEAAMFEAAAQRYGAFLGLPVAFG